MQTVFKIENWFPSSFYGRGIPFPGVPSGQPGEKIAGFDFVNENQRIWPNSPGLNIFSALGTKFYMPVGLKIEGKLYQLPWEPSLTISCQKTIIETPLAGNTRRGTVKELINVQDYNIAMQGICYDETHSSYPYDQVELIRTLCEYEGTLEIVCALTDLFEIKNVVIKGWDFPNEKGKPYAQGFSISLISDEDFILIKE